MSRQRSVSRRLTVAVLLTFAIISVFVVRLVDIQVVRAADYNAESLDKRAIEAKVAAPRGRIIDTNGVILADSITRYDITASPRSAQKPFKRTGKDGVKSEITTIEAVNEIAAITGADANILISALQADPKSDFTYLVKNVDTVEFRAIRQLEIPWVYAESHPDRTYPSGAVAGNLIGFVGTDRPLYGIEYSENSCLASTDGLSTYERGADSVRIPGSTRISKPAKPGGTIILTIDSDLQWFAQQEIATQAIAIGAESATASVIRIRDAHIMAMADWPSVDPNNISATPETFFGSRAFKYAFEPGSVMKALSSAMVLDSKQATPTTEIVVPGVWDTPDGARIQDDSPHDDEHLTFTGVIQESSNVGMSMLGSRVSVSDRYDYLRKFGLGQVTPVDFQGESEGILDDHWNVQQQYDTLYGQGIAVSSAQLAAAYQAIGNGGVRLPLTLVEGCAMPDGTVTQLPPTAGVRVVSPEAAAETIQMMESVVSGGWLSNQLQIPAYRVAAKTGTAEVATDSGYGDDRIVSVAGIAPADNPQYVVIVTYVKPDIMKTSAAAAPTFQRIMSQVLKKYRVPPSSEASPEYPTTW